MEKGPGIIKPLSSVRMFGEAASPLLKSKRAHQQAEEKILRLEKLIEEKQAAEQELLKRVTTDQLTGIRNRHGLHDHFTPLASGLARHSPDKLICCILFDVDFFKKFNDKYGHKTGDEALKFVAHTMTKGIKVRDSDIGGRWGGEEFCYFFECDNREQGLRFAEKIRHALDETPFASDGCNEKLTASFGVAFEQARSHPTLEGIVKKADDALYYAKRQGRNAVATLGEDGKFTVTSHGTPRAKVGLVSKVKAKIRGAFMSLVT